MKNYLYKLISCIWKFIFSANASKWLIVKIAQLSRISLLDLSHSRIGLLNSENIHTSGESFFIKNSLPSLIKSDKPVFFDVGANSGEFCIELRNKFPDATILAFEPNPATYNSLVENLSNYSVTCSNFGLSDKPCKKNIYTYSNNLSAGHASVYKSVFSEIHRSESIHAFEAEFKSIDSVCDTFKIPYINFLKIDTEGAELEVLNGARLMISNNKIQIIQFEFNEMNIISRCYLKDFYDLLKNYAFFRITADSLYPLGPYHPLNEIFRFQNIVCILNPGLFQSS